MAELDRRAFVRTAAAAGLAAALPTPGSAAQPTSPRARAPEVLVRKTVRPIVISDKSGYEFRNGGKFNAVERAFDGITKGEDVLDALMAGVNIPELDPLETGIGYGGLPNADGVVQLDACCMHGPKRWAGGVAALEGVKTPSLVAKAVMEDTDHHLLVGQGAQDFARNMGFEIFDDLNTDRSRAAWLEWKRRTDPGHWLDPEKRRKGDVGTLDLEERGRLAAESMIRDGLISGDSYWGTINCDGVGPNGDVCGVTTTSGLSFKIPGRVGDSPILGAGLYVDNDVGAAGSTGRGEANLYNLSSFLIVEAMRGGKAPLDAGMEAVKRIVENTKDARLLNSKGQPNFDVRFFVLSKSGEYAGAALWGREESQYAVCTENGAELKPFEGLLTGNPLD